MSTGTRAPGSPVRFKGEPPRNAGRVGAVERPLSVAGKEFGGPSMFTKGREQPLLVPVNNGQKRDY